MHYIAPSVDESTYFDFFAAHRAVNEVAHDPRVADLLATAPQYSDLFGSVMLRLHGGVSLDVSDSLHGVTVRVFANGIELEDERTPIEPNMDDPLRRDATRRVHRPPAARISHRPRRHGGVRLATTKPQRLLHPAA